MPYIGQLRRDEIIGGEYLKGLAPKTAGELNFVLTSVVLQYLHQTKPSYQMYNDAIGALEAAKLELYRRKVVPYEDEKRVINGDVY